MCQHLHNSFTDKGQQLRIIVELMFKFNNATHAAHCNSGTAVIYLFGRILLS